MFIALMICSGRARSWHQRLRQALVRDGHKVAFALVPPQPDGMPAGLDLLLRFETLVYGPPRHGLFTMETDPLAGEASRAPDLVFDLTPRGAPAGEGRRLVLTFAGKAGESRLVEALLDAQVPPLAVVEGGHPSAPPVAAGRPATESPHVLGAALDDVLFRAIGLCRQAVFRIAQGLTNEPHAASIPVSSFHGSVPGFAASGLAWKVSSRLQRLASRDHRWQTGWRAVAGPGTDRVIDTLAWPESGYRWIGDDGRRFYADPFLFRHEGRTVLFVEEFPYSTECGLIAAVDMTPDGPAGPPRPVLERPYHLSYPSVFAHGGAIYMLPETTANRTIELYRADPFPDRWVLDRVLVDNVVASDATLIEHGGRFYLLASTNEDGGSTWDQLSIFHAPALFGPWVPHPGNPLVIDAQAARPAGFTFRRGGELWRPVQDCRGGYGAGLSFCRIDRLDPQRYEQTLVASLGPDSRWGASGAHMLNTGAGFEVIDRIGPRNRG